MHLFRWLVPFSVALSVACNASDGHDHDHETDAEHTDETDATPEVTAFSLQFGAVAGAEEVGCGDAVTGLGPEGAFSIGISDLRFYVSNIVFRDAAGDVVEATLDADEFQYGDETGWVGLVDLTGTTEGDCADGSISFSEGTARTHTAITGMTDLASVAAVSFDIGVPQPLMKSVIANNTIEGAPSPLAEMYWSWASGYRHLVLNVTATDGVTEGEGYLHVGSIGCAGDGENALESKAQCDLVNTPSVSLTGFDLASDVVVIDVAALLAGLDFEAPVYNPETWEEIGTTVGVECHSAATQPDCPTFFESIGLDIASGAATASENTAFRVK
jgi:uncharacterized repeat protein (TIGR04052 family)